MHSLQWHLQWHFYIAKGGFKKYNLIILDRIADNHGEPGYRAHWDFDSVRKEFNASAAEIAYQDKWQRSQWAFCLVGTDKAYIDGAVQRLLEFLRAGRHMNLTDYHVEFL